MSTPKERTIDITVGPGSFGTLPPSPDGTPRAGSTNFPSGDNNGIDKWPEHIDTEDEKVFTKYMHDAYCALIALEKFIKQDLVDVGTIHTHHQYVCTYNDNPIIDITAILSGKTFVAGSVWVTLRGRLLEKGTVLPAQWKEGLDLRSVRLLDPNFAVIGDTIIIGYAMPMTV